jgi:hypothetical protein
MDPLKAISMVPIDQAASNGDDKKQNRTRQNKTGQNKTKL